MILINSTDFLVRSLALAFATGVTVGVLGTETREGDFEVADLCFADLPPPSACSTKDEIFEASSAGATNGDGDEEGDKWVAVLSGLEVGGDTAAMDVRLQLLVELLTGELGSDEVCICPVLFRARGHKGDAEALLLTVILEF